MWHLFSDEAKREIQELADNELAMLDARYDLSDPIHQAMAINLWCVRRIEAMQHAPTPRSDIHLSDAPVCPEFMAIVSLDTREIVKAIYALSKQVHALRGDVATAAAEQAREEFVPSPRLIHGAHGGPVTPPAFNYRVVLRLWLEIIPGDQFANIASTQVLHVRAEDVNTKRWALANSRVIIKTLELLAGQEEDEAANRIEKIFSVLCPSETFQILRGAPPKKSADDLKLKVN